MLENRFSLKRLPILPYLDLLSSYLAPQRRRMVLLAVLLLGSISLQTINPQILRYFIDAAQQQQPLEKLIQAALLFFGIALTEQMISVAAAYVSNWVGLTAVNQMRADLALHCLRLDITFHNRRTPGEMIERINGDVSALANFFSTFVLLVVSNALLLIAILLVLWYEEWRLGLALTAWAALAIYALNHVRVRSIPFWGAMRQAWADYAGFLEERLGGVEDIRANGIAAYVLRRMTELVRELYRKGRLAELMGSANVATYLLMFILGNSIALGLGAYLFYQGLISLGTVFLVYTYIGFLMIPLRQLANQLQDLQRAEASILRIRELFETRSQIADPAASALPLPDGPLSVEFDHVSFRYASEIDSESPVGAGLVPALDPGATTGAATRVASTATAPAPISAATLPGAPALSDICFRLEPGKVLGVLGRTGSGKTTLSRLLFRLYDPVDGAVRLGNVDARQASLAGLRQRVAMVTQDVQLFSATLRDNLTFFAGGAPDSLISDERIIDALQLLGLGEWFQRQPHGLDSLLVSGGGLSAGQAQLLAFARLFLRQPGLVILDEASSRLDLATEHLLERAVDLLFGNRAGRQVTGVVIAHRLSTVQRADQILILENGQICEFGEREQLARDPNSRFYGLLQTGLEEVLA